MIYMTDSLVMVWAVIRYGQRTQLHFELIKIPYRDPEAHCEAHFFCYLWPTDAYLYSQSCEIHWLEPNEFISIDWFPHRNCISVKPFKLLHVAFMFVQYSSSLTIYYFNILLEMCHSSSSLTIHYLNILLKRYHSSSSLTIHYFNILLEMYHSSSSLTIHYLNILLKRYHSSSSLTIHYLNIILQRYHSSSSLTIHYLNIILERYHSSSSLTIHYLPIISSELY
jgi:disulfide oxidoreductase YuzD